jgi:hypothetical protein
MTGFFPKPKELGTLYTMMIAYWRHSSEKMILLKLTKLSQSLLPPPSPRR